MYNEVTTNVGTVLDSTQFSINLFNITLCLTGLGIGYSIGMSCKAID